jgi:hypothetical protein
MFDPITDKNSEKKDTNAIFSVVTANYLKQEWRATGQKPPVPNP